MYHRNAQPSRGGKAQSRSRSFGNAPSRARFSRATGAGNFRKFAPKKAKLDISAFINKAAATAVVQEEFVAKHSFSDFKLSSALLQSIQKKGYTNPTAIQDGIIPSIMEGKDVVGLSNTGTGKTAAFLIPLIEKVLHCILPAACVCIL
jgi:ATP-dependent RNA helicase RhlE